MKIMVLGSIIILVSACGIQREPHFATDDIVGFGCFYEGRITKQVNKAGRFLQHNNKKAIAQWLTSSNSAQRYLAVMILERMSQQNEYTLSENEKKSIFIIRTSPDEVWICAGCSSPEQISLKELLSRQYLTNSFNYWFQYVRR